MVATGYLLTAFVIWALAVALGLARDDAAPEAMHPRARARTKRIGMRSAARRMRLSRPPELVAPAFLGLAPHTEELASRTL